MVSAPGSAVSAPPTSLLIVHVEAALEPPGRDTIYRARQPCRALGELEHVTVVSGSLLSPAIAHGGLLDEADVLVLGEAAEADLLPVLDARRRARKLTIYELAAHPLLPPPGARTEGRARDVITRGLPLHLARHADAVQFSTPALEQRFATLNTRRAIFPSHRWDPPPPPPAGARREGRVVIGWGGTSSHRDDLAAIAPALQAVVDRHPEVDLSFMGDAALFRAFAGVPGTRLAHTPAGTPHDHERFVEGLDVGLAPLLPTEYNRCRSDVRFLEYAARGALAVCADLEPYRDSVHAGETGFRFSDGAELETVLERALAEPALRAAVADRAAKYVGAERLERAHAGDRLAFYLATASQLGYPFAPREAPEEILARFSFPTFSGSRYVALGGGETERALARGLEARARGELVEARRCFTEARRLSPRAYMPELLLGETEEDPTLSIEALSRAVELNPRSCFAPYLLGLRLGLADAPDQAAAWFQRARTLAPTFGAPQLRLGELAEAAGRPADAAQMYEEAALQNASLALPVVRLATTAARGGRLDKAVALLEKTLADDPGHWLVNLALGRAYVELRRYHEARVNLERALDGTDDRPAVLAELSRAQIGVGDLDAARALLAQARAEADGVA
jgi:tetratricopeptide (TPR) repeat protein